MPSASNVVEIYLLDASVTAHHRVLERTNQLMRGLHLQEVYRSTPVSALHALSSFGRPYRLAEHQPKSHLMTVILGPRTGFLTHSWIQHNRRDGTRVLLTGCLGD